MKNPLGLALAVTTMDGRLMAGVNIARRFGNFG